MAVLDFLRPQVHVSGLHWFERNEQFWGRRAPETALQESTRDFDQFQSALPDLNELRDAAENMHVAMLRGYNNKVAGRQVAAHARAFAMYSKIPTALCSRFPRFAGMMSDFRNMLNVHKAFPCKISLDMTPYHGEVPS